MKNLLYTKSRTLEDINKYNNIFFWGAGYACPGAIECFDKNKIIGVFDNDESKWGQIINGIEVLSPQTYDFGRIKDYAVVISTASYEYEIACELKQKHIATEHNLFCSTNRILENSRYVPRLIEEHMDDIVKVYNWLADEESKEYFVRYINGCYSRNPLCFRDNPQSARAYEYNTDVADVGVKEGDIILDCGAYDGDTARLFTEKTNNNCQVYCFEPVKGNYKAILEWIKNENKDNVYAYNVGVGDSRHNDYVYSTDKVTMMGAVGNNRFNAENPYIDRILVDTLDNMVGNVPVTYIKMDVEGAEMSALRGAVKIIQENNPQMLLSGYHKLTDIWEIPMFISEITKDYKLFLGHQPHAPFEPEFMFVK